MNETNPQSLQTRYWDDVSVGDEIDGFSLSLDWTTMVQQVNGSQDWNQVHHDPDYASDSGHDGVFYNTGWTAGLLGRALAEWAGLNGWVRKLSFQMREMNKNGDRIAVKGRVTEKEETATGEPLVYLDVWIENDRVGKTSPAKGVIRLPKK
jgi:acyl dehydratase